MATDRLAGRFDAGAGAVQEITPAGGLSLQSGNLVMTEGIALVCSETGETVAARLNQPEPREVLRVDHTDGAVR